MIENWVLYGIGAAISFSGMILSFKKLLTMKIHPLILNLFLFGLVFIGFSIWVRASNTKIEVNLFMICLLILASFCSLLGNFFDVKSIQNAPNPGYSSTLKATQIVIITLLAPLIFHSGFTLLKFFGVILVFGGIFLLIK